MEREIKWKEMIESLIYCFGEKHTDYTIKHFKVEEKLTQSGTKDLIQITLLIEIEKNST